MRAADEGNRITEATSIWQRKVKALVNGRVFSEVAFVLNVVLTETIMVINQIR